MGFDISYHPISEEEIQNWYFDTLATPEEFKILPQSIKLMIFINLNFLS